MSVKEISAAQFVQMVCGEEPFSVEFERKEVAGKWTWKVHLNLPSPVLEKSFLRLFEEHIYMPDKGLDAQVSMILPKRLSKMHFNVAFDYQNAYFLKSAQRRLRDEFVLALSAWERLQKVLATNWDEGLLKAAVDDSNKLKQFFKQSGFEIALFQEAVMVQLPQVLAQIAADRSSQEANQLGSNSASEACLFPRSYQLACQPDNLEQRTKNHRPGRVGDFAVLRGFLL